MIDLEATFYTMINPLVLQLAGNMSSGSESVAKSCLGQVHLMPFTKSVAANNWSLRSGNRQNTDRSRGRSAGGSHGHHANRGGEVGKKARWATVLTRRRSSTLAPYWIGSLLDRDRRMSVCSTSWPTLRKGWEACLKVSSYVCCSGSTG